MHKLIILCVLFYKANAECNELININKDLIFNCQNINITDKNKPTIISQINLKKLIINKSGVNDINLITLGDLNMNVSLNNENNEETELSVLEPNINNLQKLYMTDNEINEIKNKMPSSLEAIFVDNNRIQKLDNDTFKKFINLKELYLNNNEISKIGNKNFEGLKLLKMLHLENNLIDVIDNDSFHMLENMTHIYLTRNNITSLSAKLFENNLQLKEIWLNNNSISNISNGMFIKNVNLELLNLESNNFAFMSNETLMELENIQMLFLGSNNIENIYNNQFSKMTKLRILDLSKNKIQNIHKNLFKNCQSLIYLNLKHNFLTVFDFVIPNILLNLDLSFNGISKIKNVKNNSSYKQLKVINLNSNIINYLNVDSIKMFNELNAVDINSNLFYFDLQRFVFAEYKDQIFVEDKSLLYLLINIIILLIVSVCIIISLIICCIKCCCKKKHIKPAHSDGGRHFEYTSAGFGFTDIPLRSEYRQDIIRQEDTTPRVISLYQQTNVKPNTEDDYM